MSSGIVFHAAAALVYGVLARSLWRRLAATGNVPQGERLTRLGLLGALILHGLGLYSSILGAGALFMGWALALSAAVWLGLGIFWLESLIVDIDSLQLLLLPTGTLAAGLAAVFPQGQFVSHAGNQWLRLHLLIALAAYGLITIAALHAVLMALLDRHLHRLFACVSSRSLFGRMLDSQPPLLTQERVLFRLIAMGFAVLTLTVGSGSVVSLITSGQVLPLDHKTLFTLLSWLTFGILLLGRHIRGWRGRVALRWTLTGFALLILAFACSRFVLEIFLQRS